MFRIRLIVSSTDISEEAELRLTSRLNETIKNYWVALGKYIHTKYLISRQHLPFKFLFFINCLINVNQNKKTINTYAKFFEKLKPWVCDNVSLNGVFPEKFGTMNFVL